MSARDVRIALRTKTSDAVITSDLELRELILGNTEKSLFYKDTDSNLFRFSPVDDANTSVNRTWSANRIVEYVTENAGGGSLQDLTDVSITSLSTGDFLQYNGSMWINTILHSSDLSDVDNIAKLDGNHTISGNWTFTNSVALTNGTITTASITANIFETNATTVNAFGAATSINVGSTTGTLTLKNPTIIGSQTTVNLWNTTSTTVNFAGAATAINTGSTTGTYTINNPTVVGSQTTVNLWNTTSTTVNFAGAATAINIGATTGTIILNNPTIVGSQTTVNLWNTTSTTVNFAGAATTLNIAAASGTTTIGNTLIVNNDIRSLTRIGILESIGATFYGYLDVGDLTADRTYELGNEGGYIPIVTSIGTGTQLLQSDGDGTYSWVAAPLGLSAGTSSGNTLRWNGSSWIESTILTNDGTDITITGILNLNNSTLATNQTTFNLVNTTATTVNFAGAGTTINIGADNTIINLGGSGGQTQVKLGGAAGFVKDLQFMVGNAPRWAWRSSNDAESGSDAGSTFQLLARNDAGGAIDTPITITRAAGGSITLSRPLTTHSTIVSSQTTVNVFNTTSTTVNAFGAATAINMGAGTGTLTYGGGSIFISPSSGSARLDIRAGSTSDQADILGRKGTSARWNLILGDSTAESGSNVGSDFAIYRYSDAGAFVATAFSITRSTGQVTIAGNLAVNGGTISTSQTSVTVLANATSMTLGAATCTFTMGNTINFAGGGDNVLRAFGGRNLVLRLGSTAGANPLQIRDAGYTVQATVSDVGILTIKGIDTGETTFSLINTTATTVNFAGAATALTIGATTGNTTVRNDFNIADGKNIILNTTTGTKIGTATTQKIGLWNATPVVQPAAVANGINGSGWTDTNAELDFNSLVTTVNAILARLRTPGIIAT